MTMNDESGSDYNAERDAMEQALPSALRIDPEHLEKFMEELTNLVRRYGMFVTGSGDLDVFYVAKMPFHELQQGRYVTMFGKSTDSHNQISPVHIVWSPQDDLKLTTIDIDNL